MNDDSTRGGPDDFGGEDPPHARAVVRRDGQTWTPCDECGHVPLTMNETIVDIHRSVVVCKDHDACIARQFTSGRTLPSSRNKSDTKPSFTPPTRTQAREDDAIAQRAKRERATAALVERHRETKRVLLDLVHATERIVRGKFNADIDAVYHEADAALQRETPEEYRPFEVKLEPLSDNAFAALSVLASDELMGKLAAAIQIPREYLETPEQSARVKKLFEDEKLRREVAAARPDIVEAVRADLRERFPIKGENAERMIDEFAKNTGAVFGAMDRKLKDSQVDTTRAPETPKPRTRMTGYPRGTVVNALEDIARGHAEPADVFRMSAPEPITDYVFEQHDDERTRFAGGDPAALTVPELPSNVDTIPPSANPRHHVTEENETMTTSVQGNEADLETRWKNLLLAESRLQAARDEIEDMLDDMPKQPESEVEESVERVKKLLVEQVGRPSPDFRSLLLKTRKQVVALQGALEANVDAVTSTSVVAPLKELLRLTDVERLDAWPPWTVSGIALRSVVSSLIDELRDVMTDGEEPLGILWVEETLLELEQARHDPEEYMKRAGIAKTAGGGHITTKDIPRIEQKITLEGTIEHLDVKGDVKA